MGAILLHSPGRAAGAAPNERESRHTGLAAVLQLRRGERLECCMLVPGCPRAHIGVPLPVAELGVVFSGLPKQGAAAGLYAVGHLLHTASRSI